MQLIFDTLLRTVELSLVAVGLSAVFSVSKFANIAHVEFATFGAIVAWLVAAWVGGGVLLAGVVAAVVAGLLAVGLERTVFRRLLRAGAAMAMVGALALEIFLRAAFQTSFGSRPRGFDRPLEQALTFMDARATPTQILMLGVGAGVLVIFMVVLYRTKVGRTVRAVAANKQLAEASGINVRRSVDTVWFMSAAVAAIGGTLIAVNTQVSVNIGFNMLLPIFAAAILGGIGSPAGAIAGAGVIAFAEKLVVQIDFGGLVGSEPAYLPISYAAAVGFVVLVITLMTRPQGLFGGGARDA